MKTTRFSDAQITAIMKQAESGVPVTEVCREQRSNRAICQEMQDVEVMMRN